MNNIGSGAHFFVVKKSCLFPPLLLYFLNGKRNDRNGCCVVDIADDAIVISDDVIVISDDVTLPAIFCVFPCCLLASKISGKFIGCFLSLTFLYTGLDERK